MRFDHELQRRLCILLLALGLIFAGMALVSPDAEARVVRIEKADRQKPARVKYVHAVSVWTNKGWKRRTYVELKNGATFRVTKCKKPVRIKMRMKRVRRLCGRK